MKKLLGLTAAMVMAAAMTGCNSAGEVSESDQRANEKANSQASYEDAMKKAGRGAELEEQKRLNEERQQGDR